MSIQKEIEKLHEQASELAELKEDLFNAKSDLTIQAVAVLISKLDESVEGFMEIAAKKDYYDKELGNSIKSTVSDLVKAFSEIKAPTVNVTPNISVDLKPFYETVKEVLNQNTTIIALINKLESGSKNEDLKPFVEAMVQRSNSFLEKAFNQIDYTKSLDGIEAALKDRPSKWKARVTKRDGMTKDIEELVITSIKE